MFRKFLSRRISWKDDTDFKMPILLVPQLQNVAREERQAILNDARREAEKSESFVKSMCLVAMAALVEMAVCLSFVRGSWLSAIAYLLLQLALWCGIVIGVQPRLMMPFIRDELEKRGRCKTCGYDLCATPDRCPECGTEPE